MKTVRTPEQEKFYSHLRNANQNESKNPLESLEELRVCYKMLKYQTLNLPKEQLMLQQISNRINYLIDKLGEIAYETNSATKSEKSKQKSAKLIKNKSESAASEKEAQEEGDFNVKTDISDMNKRLENLEEEYNQKLQEIEADESLTQKEKSKRKNNLKKWKKNQELTILTEQALQEKEEIVNQSDEIDDGDESSEIMIEEDISEEYISEENEGNDENESEGEILADINEEILEDNEIGNDNTGFPNQKSEIDTTNSSQSEISNNGDQIINGSKPLLKSLVPTEMEKIWEFYFLHPFNHPTPEEYYGNGEAKQKILQMLQQITEIYDKYDPTHVVVDNLPGDSKIYFIGDILGSFEAVDRLMRFFQPKIFEAQATENPLRLIFLGNFTGGTEMDFHTLLYLICFNILYPNEVILLRGTHEEKKKFERLKLKKFIKERFDQEIVDAIYKFFQKLPIAYYIESPHRLILSMHGYLPINSEQPEIPINIFNQHFQASKISINEMDTITQQVIANLPALRMKKDSYFSDISGSVGLKINQTLFEPFIQENKFELMVIGNHTIKNGYRVYYDNRLVGLVSALKYKGKEIKGKILEVKFPPDPEEYEEEYEEGETGEEEGEYMEEDEYYEEEGEYIEEEEYYEEGDDYVEGQDDHGEDSGEIDEQEADEENEDNSEKHSDSLFGIDEKEVEINLIDISKL